MASPNEEPTLIWLRREPAGRRPRYSREQIARAALTIADAEGFDAVTMKRISAELGAGTMTLYYYVRNKADIVTLMQDAILEDVLIPAEELPEGWREGVTAISRRTWDVLTRHPWSISSLNQAQFGPNAMRHYEQSLAVLRHTNLTGQQKIELTAIVDAHVAGNAIHAIETQERIRAAASDPTLIQDAMAYGQKLVAGGDFPELQALAASPPDQAEEPEAAVSARFTEGLATRFTKGLAALLDGLERSYAITSTG